MNFKKVHVIINPASGQNRPILNILNNVFRDYDLTWSVSVTHKAGDGAQQAREAVGDDCDLVMAYGGDGTQLDVAAGMMETDVPMGILPGGTANALAVEMGVPLQLPKAARLPFTDRADAPYIDIGVADDEYFLLRIGTGMIATFSETASRELKDMFGIGAYIIGGVQAISNPKYVTYKLTIDGKIVQIRGSACLVTNGNSLGVFNLKLSPHVNIADGLLDVFIIQNDIKSILGAVGSIAQLDASLQHWQCKTLKIATDQPQAVYADGETTAFTQTPSNVYIKSKALRVISTLDGKRV